MKRITVLLLTFILSSTFVEAQEQRLVLVEEFTNASCGPCASTNPAFNAFLNANASKVVAIKYQTSWPGTDPFYSQNPSQVDTRVNYYSISGVPHAIMDGNVQDLHPASLSQSMLDAQYAVPAGFNINLSHSFNANFDTITIVAVFKATDTLNYSNLAAHVAIIEREVYFSSAPGSNGETEFFDVMRKMYPSDQGTSLGTAWVPGDSVVISFTGAVPSYIYDKGQIAVVAFVQDNSTKNVKQAALSDRIPLPLDASVEVVDSLEFINCQTALAPSVVIENKGADTLYSMNVIYTIDNGTKDTVFWTGVLEHAATTSVSLPNVNAVGGEHTLHVIIESPNGQTDMSVNNNSYEIAFAVIDAYSSLPVAQDFSLGVFPPTNWINYNPDNGEGWSRSTAGGFGQGSGSAKCDFFNSTPANVDILYAEAFDLSAMSSAVLTFNYAYARYSASYADTMRVQISADCGQTWNQLFFKYGSTLATASDHTSGFTPTSSEWELEIIDISGYTGNSEVIVRFYGGSGWGNNLYVDDISIADNLLVDENELNFSYVVYPNPVKDILTINVNTQNSVNVEIELSNTIGQTILAQDIGRISQGQHSMQIDCSVLEAGLYLLNVKTGNMIENHKIIVE